MKTLPDYIFVMSSTKGNPSVGVISAAFTDLERAREVARVCAWFDGLTYVLTEVSLVNDRPKSRYAREVWRTTDDIDTGKGKRVRVSRALNLSPQYQGQFRLCPDCMATYLATEECPNCMED